MSVVLTFCLFWWNNSCWLYLVDFRLIPNAKKWSQLYFIERSFTIVLECIIFVMEIIKLLELV